MWKPGPEPDTQTIQFSCSSCVLCILLFFSLLSVPCFALPAGALPYPCPSLGDGGLIQERLVIWVKFQGKTVLDVWPKIFTFQAVDTLFEWSKGVDSSSTSANCVGSNPTGVQKLLAQAELSEACHSQSRQVNSTPRGFKPLRAEPIGFRVQLLSRSDTVSSAS